MNRIAPARRLLQFVLPIVVAFDTALGLMAGNVKGVPGLGEGSCGRDTQDRQGSLFRAMLGKTITYAEFAS